jgi:Tol biopolymer transport system component
MTNKASIVKTLGAAIIATLLTLALAMPVSGEETNPDAQKWVDISAAHPDHMYHHPDVSPDGKHVVFSVSPNDFDKGTVWIRTIESGQQRQLTYTDTTMNRGDVLVKWSPKGDLIAFASDRDGENHLYTVPIAGGEITRLTHKPLAGASPWYCFFSWAPDGRKIVFRKVENENENLYVMDLESQTVEQLTHHAGFEVRDPDWSADGASIVYVSDRREKPELWIYDLASQNESVIESDEPNMYYPVWSPDGQWIAFQRGGNRVGTYIIPRQGGEATRVGPGWAYANWGPAWDRDGKHLLYHAAEVVDTPLMVHELASGAKKRLLDDIKASGWHWASWDPQGTYLTFHQITENTAGKLDTSLYLSNVASTEVRRITRSTLVDRAPKKQAPAWMPDGRRFIAILGENGETQLAMIEVDNPSPRVLTRSPSLKMEAAVSPDGELVAYIAALEDKENIWLYDLVIDEEFQLTFSGSVIHELAFSPDGSQIAFVQKNPSTGIDIMSIATEGGDIQQHTRYDGWELHPKWLDNETIYFTHTSQDNGYRDAAQVNTRTGQLTHVLSDEEGHIIMPYVGPDLKYLNYQRGWPNGPLLRTALPAKTTTTLIDGKIGRPLFSADGSRVAYIDEVNQPMHSLWRENVERIVNLVPLP